MPKKNRNVLAMGLVSFFNDIGSEMIFPLLPLFITTTLGAPAVVLGIIEGVAESTAAFMKLGSGTLSDRIGKRKAIVVSGYSLSALTKPFFSIATMWQHVLAVRFTDRVGKGLRDAPRDALLAASTKNKKKGSSFGFVEAMDRVGAIVGTLTATALLAMAFTYRQIFLFALIPSILSAIVAAIFIKEISHAPLKRLGLPWKNHFAPELKRFLIVAGLFNVAGFSYAFYLLRAQQAGLSVVLMPIAYLTYVLFYAVGSYPAGKLSDRIGRKKVIASGYLLFALSAIGFATAGNALVIWPLLIVYGLQMAFTDSVSRAFITDMVGDAKRGTALGAYYFTIGLAALPASVIAGFIWDRFGSATTFSLAAVLALMALLLLTTIKGKVD
jgi:MFS family permease